MYTHKTKCEAFINGDYVEWTKEKVKRAFNFGEGTTKDLIKYANDNLKNNIKFYSIQ